MTTIVLSPDRSSQTDPGNPVSENATEVVACLDTVTSIGLASLLPENVRVLCSCAHLFFARLVGRSGEGYLAQVAALTHYLDASLAIRKRHVRTIFLTPDQCAQLLQWDRRLASLATGDVREMVEKHVSKVGCASQLPVRKAETSHCSKAPDRTNERPQKEDALPPVEPAAFFCEGPRVSVSLSALQEAVNNEAALAHLQTLQRLPTCPQHALLLLQAALIALGQQREREQDARFRKQLLRQEQEIRRVLAWHRIWKPRLDVSLAYARGKGGQVMGCILQVGVPLPLVA